MNPRGTAPAGPRRARRRWWRDCLAGLAITVALGLALEVAARVYWHRQTVSILDDFAVVPPSGRWTLVPGFRKNGIDVNSLGFRGPETTVARPPGTVRVVALGDSVTFGHKLHVTYPALLQARLARRPDCREQIELINAGVPGYQTRFIRDRLAEDVRPLQPDVLLVLAGWNDIYSDNPASPAKRLDPHSPFNRLLHVSYAAKALTKLAFDLRPARGEASPTARRLYESFTEPVFRGDYARLLEVADDMRVPVVMLTLPSLLGSPDWSRAAARIQFPYYTSSVEMLRLLWDKYNQAIRDLAAHDHRRLIDLAREIAEVPGSERLFADTNHLNPRGTTVLAELLERDLLATGLLPCGARPASLPPR
jgi:lysophospholipase L1-like esterase